MAESLARAARRRRSFRRCRPRLPRRRSSPSILALAACRYAQRRPGAAAGRGADRGGAGAARAGAVARDSALDRRRDRGDWRSPARSASRRGCCRTKSRPSAGGCRASSATSATAMQSASPRQSLIRQLQQAVTELEKTDGAGEADRCHAGDDRRDGRRAAPDDERRAPRGGYLSTADPAAVPDLLPAGRRARCSSRSS